MTMVQENNVKKLNIALNVVCNDIATKEATNSEFQEDLETVQADSFKVIQNEKIMDDVRDIIDNLVTDGYSDNGIDDYNDLYHIIYNYEN